MTRVKDKIAVVTGAGSGIGAAIARTLADNGAKVVATDQNAEAAEKTAKEILRAGNEAISAPHDVTKPEEWDAVIRSTEARYRKFDILVNCAGIFSDVGQPFDAISIAAWRQIMSVNLDSVFFGCRAGVMSMKKTGGGCIINIGSITGFRGTNAGAAYGTSKGAISALTKHVAYSCAINNYNIRANVIHPGHVWTPANAKKSVPRFGSEEAAIKALADLNPMKMMGTPDDVAWAAVYLASDESRFMTGADIVIDGGRLSSD